MRGRPGKRIGDLETHRGNTQSPAPKLKGDDAIRVVADKKTAENLPVGHELELDGAWYRVTKNELEGLYGDIGAKKLRLTARYAITLKNIKRPTAKGGAK